ncbi:MAG TPA: hypothetical protein PK530_05300 [Anaerolineales bacterium]|nr:hypothetical protein [Anaerolineales bacterium]
MKKSKLLLYTSIVLLLLLLPAIFLLRRESPLLGGVDAVRGKAPSLPLSDVLTPEESLAQDLALSAPRVLDLTTGKKSEVFTIQRVGMDFPPGREACAHQDCRQVEIYLWAENATLTTIVNLETREVLDVLYQPGFRPPLSARLMQRAAQIIYAAPEVAQTLGFAPALEDITPMQGDLVGSSCDGTHICASATFQIGKQILWATADLTEDKFAGLAWSEASEDERSAVRFIPEGCPLPGAINRDGWALQYETTPTDGLRAFAISYNGVYMVQSLKLVEWHVQYGVSGFLDFTGCGGQSGGNFIAPYGETQIHDLLDAGNNVIGFELIQDFRMGNWGFNCNYRYDQHFQFFADGRFRVVQGAYGKGCGTLAFYRAVVMMDLAIKGQSNDHFAYWDGVNWVPLTIEDYRVPYEEAGHGPHLTTPEGYAWKIYDTDGAGYYLEMDSGQFGDGGRGDQPFVYVTQYQTGQGNTDMPLIGTCCNNDHQQGPHNFLNPDESVVGQNLVLWYVPQAMTDALNNDTGYYCWTVSGEPAPETYPCYTGPMFHLIGPVTPPGDLTEFVFLPLIKQ